MKFFQAHGLPIRPLRASTFQKRISVATSPLFDAPTCDSPRDMSVPSVESMLRVVDQESLRNATPTELKWLLRDMKIHYGSLAWEPEMLASHTDIYI